MQPAFSRAEYMTATNLIDMLLDKVGNDENHPLADVLDCMLERARIWEDANASIPDAEPADVLRFLMAEHGLKQGDLKDCAPQARISDILNGKRGISKAMARKLAARFGVPADSFL